MLAAQKQIESLQRSQLDMMEAVLRTLVGATESVTNANLAAACAFLQTGNDRGGGQLTAQGRTGLPTSAGDLLQVATEVQKNYSQKLSDIAWSTSGELVQIAKAHLGDSGDRICELMGMSLQGGPAGSEVPILFLKNAFAAPNVLFDAFLKAAKDAVHAVKPNEGAASMTAGARTTPKARLLA
jgi:hypothetical protein